MSRCSSCYHQINGVECSVRDGVECCINHTWRSWKPITEKEPTKYKCHYSKCVSYNKTYSGNCTYRSGNEIPTCKYYKQYKEDKMKEYTPTSKCTLKNIIKKIGDTNCDEARIEFFSFFYGLIMHDINISTENFNSVITNGSLYFDRLTKTEKRRNWLSEHGFIEEEIKYKCYTIDYMSYNLNIKTKVEFNGYIDDEDEDTLFFKLDNGKAFNIDKDLITNIKPKTPF